VEQPLSSAVQKEMKEMFSGKYRVKLSRPSDHPRSRGGTSTSHDPLRREHRLKALYKAVQVGNRAQDIIGDDQVSGQRPPRSCLPIQYLSLNSAEIAPTVERPLILARRPPTFCGRLSTPRTGTPFVQKNMLQPQVASVFCCHLHDQRNPIRMKTLNNAGSVYSPRMIMTKPGNCPLRGKSA